MPVARALRVLDQICSALVEAHGSGIVHRDLKPDNVMLADRHGNPDYVKVLDFGIAKLVGDDARQATLTQVGAVFGTPRYMAPEQAQGGTIDARTDIYSLGIIFFEMLTGSHPFPHDSAVSYMVAHTLEEVVPPSQDERYADLGVPPRVEALMLRCVQKDPAQRFQSVAELQREVRLAMADLPDAARGYAVPVIPPPAAVARTVPSGRTTPAASGGGGKVWLIVALVVLLLGGAGAGLYFGGVLSSEPAASAAAAKAETPPPKKKRKKKRKKKSSTATTPSVAATGAGDRDDPEDSGDLDDPAADDAKRPRDKTGASTTPPPKDDAPPATAPTLAVGERVDGFPLPAGARRTATTPQAIVFESGRSARELIAFYRWHIGRLYGQVEAMPNGLQILNPLCPFSYVSLSKAPDGLMVVLSRNVMVDKPATGTEVAEAFGVAVMPGAAELVRTPDVVTLTTQKPAKEVYDFYQGLYGKTDGATVLRQDATFVISVPEGKVPWKMISVVIDPSHEGRLMISVLKR
jgi:hypothetical protein